MTLQPHYLDGPHGRIFGLYYPPAVTAAADYGNLVFIPPFAEELNRSRHMIARQARLLAAAGIGVFVPDLYGTGDSEGRFEDARWDIWLENIERAISWLKDQNRPVCGLWAMRTGALLAADLISTGRYPPSRLLLWAPVANGDIFINQFLRIRVAAELVPTTGRKQTTRELREKLQQGITVEVGGYGLSGTLATAMATKKLSAITIGENSRIYWVDIGLGDKPTLSPGAQKHVEAWRIAGAEVTASAVTGPAFWTLQETEWAENLLAETGKLIKAGVEQ